MLQYSTVNAGTLELLKSLMQKEYLASFNLAGGTALALRIGHRISIDIDLFTNEAVDFSEIRKKLEQDYNLINIQENKGGLNQNIEYPENSNNFIKVDIVKYKYSLLKPVITKDSIRLLSQEDIIPMKLAAIANRGAKKDFFDLYFLLHSFSIKEMLSLFEQKFSNYNSFYVIKSMTYFEDAEADPTPKLLMDCSWNDVKSYIKKMVKETL